MKKQVLYKYLGTNGTIESPIHLEDIYYIRKYCLTADPGKVLTNGERKVYDIRIPEEDLALWFEVDDD